MRNLEDVMRILRSSLADLKKRYDVERIGVFGSFVRGQSALDSDVDIYVEFGECPGLAFVDFAEHLEKLLGKKVDLITPAGLDSIRNDRIREEIKRSIRYV